MVSKSLFLKNKRTEAGVRVSPKGPLFEDLSHIFMKIFVDAPVGVSNDPFFVDQDIRLDPGAEGLRHLIAFVICHGEGYVVLRYEIGYLIPVSKVYAYEFYPAAKLLI